MHSFGDPWSWLDFSEHYLWLVAFSLYTGQLLLFISLIKNVNKNVFGILLSVTEWCKYALDFSQVNFVIEKMGGGNHLTV